MSWEHFPHGADVGVRGRGQTLADALSSAASAVTAVVVDPQQVSPSTAVEIRCEAPSAEYLLVDWINALVYEMATRGMLFSKFDVECDQRQLRARAWGEPVDVARHCPAVEVKGATLTALDVHREPSGEWLAQCVVDV